MATTSQMLTCFIIEKDKIVCVAICFEISALENLSESLVYQLQSCSKDLSVGKICFVEAVVIVYQLCKHQTVDVSCVKNLTLMEMYTLNNF